MTFIFRPLRLPVLPLAPVLALVGLLAAVLAFTSTADARVVPVEGQLYGVQGHATVLEETYDPFSSLEYGGGPVMGTNNTYAIYWDPAVLRPGDPGRPGKYHGDWQQLINQFLTDVGANSGDLGNVFSLTPQYTETNGTRATYSSTFRGGAVDRDMYPSDGCTDPAPGLNRNFACFTDAQLRTELKNYLANNQIHAGLGTIFYLLTPPNVTICTDTGGASGHCSDSTKVKPWKEMAEPPSLAEEAEEESYKRSFCSYHSFTSTASAEPLLYAVIPWVAGSYGAKFHPEMLPNFPNYRNGSDCQDGSGIEQEPNSVELSPDGYSDHGLADILINQVAAEQFATITDPTLNGWNEPLSGNEAPDQCRDWFEAPPIVQGSGSPDEHTEAGHYFNQIINEHDYYLNTEYNQAAQYYAYPGLRCELHNNLVPSFTTADPVNSGDVVGFDGAESDITLEQSADPTTLPNAQPQYRATFSWNFGDGTPVVSGTGFSGPNASSSLYASVFHAYQYGGTYQATLTVTDAAGNVASVSHPITVDGPPPPSNGGGSGGGTPNEESGAPGSAGGAATPTGTTTGKGSGTGQPPAPQGTPPIASAVAGSRSLARALRQGLVVNYSVNQQVAGHFEVLLDSGTAHRLGIKGRKAVGLPAGSPQSLIVGQAILVTTKGGHSSVRIKFSPRTSARLRRVRKLTLLLRLVVRNSATQSTTVLTPVLLRR